MCDNYGTLCIKLNGNVYLKNEYTNNIIKEIDNINNAVEKIY